MTVVSLPAAAAARARGADDRAERILAAVDVPVPQLQPPAAYAFVLGVLAVFLALLPLVYLTLAAFLGWLVIWHVIQTFTSLEYGPYFVFHVPMAFFGGLLLLFLVKPIFFRRKGSEADVLTLSPDDEPLLFEFIRRLCAATGSVAPSKIEVDCNPNASAGIPGVFRGLLARKLVLRVGLPLVAGMSVRQFAGVLGHEFGHFNQRSGMTGSYLIRRLNYLFAAVAFQRDRIDEKLLRLRHSRNAFAKLFYWLAVALVEPMRGVLWLMLMIGELLTCSVLRRMEYDADHVEAHLAGVRDFVRTNRLLLFLNLAARRARHDLADALDRRQLADDLPALIAANARQLVEHRDDIFKLMDEEKTSWFDTHPCHNDRVRNVEQIGAAGLVECDTPASALFADFTALCRRATEAFYLDALGEKQWSEAKESSRMVRTADIAADRAGQRQAGKSLRRFFRNQMVTTRPIFPDPAALAAADDLPNAAHALSMARRTMLQLADGMGAVVDQYDEAVSALPAARAQIELCGIFSFNPKAHTLRYKAENLQRTHRPLLIQSSRQLAAFEEPARQRLTTALRLLQRDDVLARLPGAFADDGAPLPLPDPRATVTSLIQLCQSLHGVLPKIEAVRESAVALQVLFSAYSPENPYQPLVRSIVAAINRLIDLLREVQTDLRDTPYPFAHGTDGISVGAALVPQVPTQDDPADVNSCAGGTLDKYFTLVFRTLATLTEWAEKVESATGLDPLPEPEEREAKDDQKEKAEAKRNSRRYWFGYGGRAAAGLVLVAAIVTLSLSPPDLPTMPWEKKGASANRGRPASFNTSVRTYTNYQPSPPVYRDAYGRPVYPGTPGYPNGSAYPGTPGMPGYPNNPNPYAPSPGYPANPNPSVPGRYAPPQPPGYTPGRYTPPSPGGGTSPGRGGGGYTPGGGRSPGGGGGSSPGGGRGR